MAPRNENTVQNAPTAILILSNENALLTLIITAVRAIEKGYVLFTGLLLITTRLRYDHRNKKTGYCLVDVLGSHSRFVLHRAH